MTFPALTRQLLIPALALAAALLQAATPEQLVDQLKTGDATARDAAARELLAVGDQARPLVRDLLQADDPALREHAAKLWEELRWYVVPGAGKEAAALANQAAEGKVSPEQWQDFIKKGGVASIQLIAEMLADPRHNAAAIQGFGVWLEMAPPPQAAKALQGFEEPRRTELDGLLERFALEADTRELPLRVLAIVETMGRHEEALRLARGAFVQTLDQRLVLLAAGAARAGKLEARVWEDAGQALYLETIPARRVRMLAYYAHLAAALNAKQVVPTLLRIAPPTADDPNALQSLAHRLLEMGFKEQAEGLLKQSTNPALLYLRQVAGSEDPDAKLTDEQWQELLAKVETEEQAFALARQLARHGEDARVQEVWWHTLEIEPKESIYDANALLQIAKHAEATAHFGRAAEYYRKGLDLAEKTNFPMPPQQKDQIREQIEEMTRCAANDEDGYESSMQRGRKAMVDSDFSTAIAEFEAAVKARPREREALMSLYEAAKAANNFAKVVEVGRQIVALPAEGTDKQMQAAMVAVESGQAEKALELCNQVLAELPEWGQAYATRASAYERLHQPDKAIADLQKALELGADKGAMQRQIGILQAEKGDLTAAAQTLLEATQAGNNEDYTHLWLFHVRNRLGRDALLPLAEFFAKRNFGDDDWTPKLMLHAVGDITDAKLLEAASASEDKQQVAARLCEAWFYVGQKALAKGDKAAAVEAFKKCRSYNIEPFVEHVWSSYELRQLEP